MCAAVNDVYLDYQMVCQLENGERYNATLPLGEHHLEIIDKVNFNKTIYSGNFIIGKAGLIMSCTASLKVNDMQMATFPSGHIAEKPATPIISSSPAPSEQNVSFTRQSMPVQQGKICPKCGGQMTLQVINEQKKTGCGTILGYIFLE